MAAGAAGPALVRLAGLTSGAELDSKHLITV